MLAMDPDGTEAKWNAERKRDENARAAEPWIW
jgi:hypothetical protein